MGFPSSSGLGFAQSLAGSPGSEAESSSSSFGRVTHLQLFPTPPHGGCSYFQLQAGERMPEEDLHLSDHARSQAH